MAVIGTEEMNSGQEALYKRCKIDLEGKVKDILDKKVINPLTLTDLRKKISEEAESLRKGKLLGETEAGEAVLFMNHIDKEEVVRVYLREGKVVIPSRGDALLELTDKEIDACGLRPLVTFLQSIIDEEKLRSVFAKYCTGRF
ncbi:MAG: hypothetical protein ABIH47_00325, partial [Candidatus Omnitrophota bacterium]